MAFQVIPFAGTIRKVLQTVVPILTVVSTLGAGNYSIAQRELTDIPVPDPMVEKATFQIGDGWEVELFAGDPKLAKPIHMNWDNRRRLWVASSETYPQVKPGEAPNDKILIIEDLDQDGKADRTTVFADGLLIPTGVLPANDSSFASAYVVNSDQLLYLADTNGDMVADERKIVLSGFGTEDTHHLLHSLRWGHDGWIYMNQSIYIHSHIETPWGVERLNGGGIWRFHPASKKLEVYAYGFVNPWGVHFDRYGQVFATDGAYGEGINYVFPGSVFVTAVGASRIVAGLNPGSPKHCSLEILSGSHWPDSIRGSMVTNDFRAHRVCRFNVTDEASGYESIQQQELIKTSHVAFRPIDAKQGLDGCLYIADWYNPIIQHGEVDFRDPRRDRTHGRIWRLKHKDQKATANEAILSTDPVEKNLARLRDDADLVRLYAGQALLLRSKTDPATRKSIDERIDAIVKDKGAELEQLEMLWLLEGLNEFNASLQQSTAASADGRIRAASVRSASHEMNHLFLTGKHDASDPAVLAQWLKRVEPFVRDPHPRVRLEAVRMLSGIKDPMAAQMACEVLKQPMDRFLDFALWQTIRDLKSVWLPQLLAGKFRFGDNTQAMAFAFRAVEDATSLDAAINVVESGSVTADSVAIEIMRLVAELGQPHQQKKLLQWLTTSDSPAIVPVLRSALSPALKADLLQTLTQVTKNKKQQIALEEPLAASLLESAKSSMRLKADDPARSFALAAIRALGTWKTPSARPVFESALADGATPVDVRQSLVGAVAGYGDDASRTLIAGLISDKNADVAMSAVEQLVDIDLKLACNSLADRLQSSTDPSTIKNSILTAILARKSGVEELTAAIATRKLTPDVAKSIRNTVRSSGLAVPGLVAAIEKASGISENRWVWNDELKNSWLEIAKTSGDPARGEMVYRRTELQCAQCHRIGGVGGIVGPDLTSIGANAPADYLLEALVAPAAKVKEGYHAKSIRTEDDEIVTGIPVRETETEVVFRLADGKEKSVTKANIADNRDSRSLMPDGLLDSLSREEAVDLLRFIMELGRIDGSMLVKPDGSIRSWQHLVWTQPANTLLNRTSLDSIAGDQSQFTWQSTAALVSGALPLKGLATYQPHGNIEPTTFLSSQVNITKAGSLRIELGSLNKQSALLWVNGVPATISGNTVEVAVPVGACNIHVGINRKQVPSDSIQIRLDADKSTAKFQFPQ